MGLIEVSYNMVTPISSRLLSDPCRHTICYTVSRETLIMRRTGFLFATAAVLSLALAPGLAYARAGSNSSMGSRGSMTNSAPPTTNTAPTTAQPMQRSTTQNAAGPTAAGAPAAATSRGGSFMAGMAGGLLGMGLAGMLMGHGFFGSGMGGFGFLGLLLQMALLGGAVWFVVRLIRSRRQPALAGGPQTFARDMQPDQRPMGGLGGGASRGAVNPVAIGPADYQSFEQLLKSIQAAWSNQDEGALRGMTTPEMASYFGEQLMEQRHRGHRNTISDVKLESGDLAQAWAENGDEYATVAMRFSMNDVTRDQSGKIVEGDAAVRDVATELWTFVRPLGGQWALSAIQQTR
jgi:predicted lipid-binding transport protein (Tim44 family)